MAIGSSVTNYRRVTDPVFVPVGVQATEFNVSDGLILPGLSAFRVLNKNRCVVRLRGSRGAFAPVTLTTGWGFAPGEVAIYGTQNPQWMSAMAEDTPMWPLTDGMTFVPLELSYGFGS